jgi:ubiquinone/menaquinone biosynthesis C-methylase UbiE
LCSQPQTTGSLVQTSYDRIAAGYDDAWTHHMRGLSAEMVDRLGVWQGAECIDLTCGTGFVTSELARRAGRPAVGVDASAGMIDVAGRRFGDRCVFVQADALAFLRSRPGASADIVTCGWGLGYTRPWAVIREVARVLRPGGRFGVIDNTLFSLAEVLRASILAFAERPEALAHVMRVRFLPGASILAAMMRLSGLAVRDAWNGAKTYHVRDGNEAIARLTATGAAAGFEFAAWPDERSRIFRRFTEIVEERYAGQPGIPITHRYLAAIGEKP